MSEVPISVAKKSLALDIKAGTYWWCSCGRSSHQPWCDGSHKGTGLQPFKLELPTDTSAHLCQCRATKTPPYCDGSHKTL